MPLTVDDLSFVDPSERCFALREIWPELPERVVAEFNRVWLNSAIHKARAGLRWRAFRPNVGEASPAFHSWEREVFELCFQSVLNELRIEMWRRGEFSEQNMMAALDVAVPSVYFDIAIELSMAPRPKMILPSQLAESVEKTWPEEGDKRYRSWIRVGYYEMELKNLLKSREKCEYVVAFGGMVLHQHQQELSPSVFPLTEVDSEACWSITDFPVINVLPELCSVCGHGRHESKLHEMMMLAVHPVVAAALRLSVNQRPGPLNMVSQDGREAVKLRVWKSGPMERSGFGDVFELEGCDLLLRPDVFKELSSRVAEKYSIITRVHRQSPA